ncbi:hypothetical protein M422DRAFT_88704, partial [Sphaerobolus stellatus SS14]
EMEVLQEQIKNFRQQLEELENQRDALEERLQFHQAMVAPIRRLFPELLMRVFGFCIETDTPSFRRNSAPLVLTHVCHSWRQLALNCPSLW